MQELRQSTEMKVRVGPFVDVSDGFTPQTDITLAGNEAEALKHNGAATVDISSNTWAAVTGCRGWYDLTLTTDDTDTLGQLTIVVQDDSDCLPVFRDFLVVTQNYWDSKYSTDKLQVDCVQWLGTACSTPTTAGVPEVDITYIGGDAQSMTDIKDFADTGYDPSTHKVQGLVLCDTTTTNTDVTALAAIATEARLAELDAANIPSDLDDVLTHTTELQGLISSSKIAAQVKGIDTDIITADSLNADAVDEIWAEAMSDLAAGAPSATASVLTAINYIYEAWRNKTETTASEIALYKDDGTTKLAESDISDDGTTFTKGEWGAAD